MLWKAINGRAADVKRCHALRDVLPLFDVDSPDSEDLLELLTRAAMSPVFLRCPEGRRLLATFFSLSADIIPQLTAVIRNQVLGGRASLLDAYGAWAASVVLLSAPPSTARQPRARRCRTREHEW